jgi:hypothetical protein
MTDERLPDIALLLLEKDFTTGTFIDDTIRELEGIDNNRSIFFPSSLKLITYYNNYYVYENHTKVKSRPGHHTKVSSANVPEFFYKSLARQYMRLLEQGLLWHSI